MEKDELTIKMEKSFMVAKLAGGLFSVNGKICTTTTGMLDAVRAEFGVTAKPRKPKK